MPIALSSPPQQDHGGLPHPTILAACALLGVEEVYAVGGAQAIAMFAYGVGSCARVDLVTGPGNIWTVTAKRLLKGQVGIDSEAGPTEIAILADDTADAAYVAADLVSQAEHDPLAAAVLVTDSLQPGRRRRARAREAGARHQAHRAHPAVASAAPSRRSCWSTTSTQGLEVVNAYAAEHLEMHTADAASLVAAHPQRRARSSSGRTRRSRSATTAPGPTTCCPPAAAPATPRACRSARSPGRCRSSTTRREALAAVADHVVALAEAEDLPGHGAAVRVRFAD